MTTSMPTGDLELPVPSEADWYKYVPEYPADAGTNPEALLAAEKNFLDSLDVNSESMILRTLSVQGELCLTRGGEYVRARDMIASKRRPPPVPKGDFSRATALHLAVRSMYITIPFCETHMPPVEVGILKFVIESSVKIACFWRDVMAHDREKKDNPEKGSCANSVGEASLASFLNCQKARDELGFQNLEIQKISTMAAGTLYANHRVGPRLFVRYVKGEWYMLTEKSRDHQERAVDESVVKFGDREVIMNQEQFHESVNLGPKRKTCKMCNKPLDKAKKYTKKGKKKSKKGGKKKSKKGKEVADGEEAEEYNICDKCFILRELEEQQEPEESAKVDKTEETEELDEPVKVDEPGKAEEPKEPKEPKKSKKSKKSKNSKKSVVGTLPGIPEEPENPEDLAKVAQVAKVVKAEKREISKVDVRK